MHSVVPSRVGGALSHNRVPSARSERDASLLLARRHNTLMWGDRSLSCTTTGRHSLTAQGCVPHAPQQGQSRPAVTLTSGDDALTTQCQGRWQCCHQFSLWVTSHSPLPSTAIIAVHSRVPSYASRNLLFCSMLWVLHTYRAAPSGLKLLSPCPEGLCS